MKIQKKYNNFFLDLFNLMNNPEFKEKVMRLDVDILIVS